MEKSEATDVKENRIALSILEFALIAGLLLVNFDVIHSVSLAHWQTNVSKEVAFLGVLAALGFLHFMEPSKRARHRNMYFREASRQGLIVGAVISLSICIQHFNICQKLSKRQEDTESILTIYKSYAISMSIATIFYGLLYLFNIDLAFVAPVIMLSLGLLQDHFSDINFVIPLGAVIVYFFIFMGLIRLCPRSFTIAEGVIISQGTTLLLIDFSLLFIVKLGYKSLLDSYNLEVLENRADESLMLSVLLASAIMISICLSPIFYYLSWHARTKEEIMIYSVAFYVGGLMNACAVFFPLTYIILGVNPVWYIATLLTPSVICLVIWWIFLLSIAVAVMIWKASENQKVKGKILPNIIVRKFFHLVAILIFVPGIYVEPNVTKLASGVALVGLVICEYIRIFKIYPFGEVLDRYLLPFLDERDSGKVILTHIYLLFGFAFPLWLFPFNAQLSPCILLPFSGVISLGVGDSFASIAGKTFAKMKILGSSKTYIGMLACISSQFLAFLLLMVSTTGYISLKSAVLVFCAAFLTGIVECVTSQIDNLVLPPVTYILLACLFNR